MTTRRRFLGLLAGAATIRPRHLAAFARNPIDNGFRPTYQFFTATPVRVSLVDMFPTEIAPPPRGGIRYLTPDEAAIRADAIARLARGLDVPPGLLDVHSSPRPRGPV